MNLYTLVKQNQLADKFYDHYEFECVMKQGGNRICIHREKIEFLRRQKKRILLRHLTLFVMHKYRTHISLLRSIICQVLLRKS